MVVRARDMARSGAGGIARRLAWRRQSFLDELGYHLFGDICVVIAVMAVPFLLLRQRRRPEHLQALEAQLHPHFLFNTLNSIATLMHEDVDAADEMMAKLGTLLRRTMDQQGAVEVPLKEELEILEIYLDIQRTRYADRLTTELSVDRDTLDILVPRLILQPIVENAVRQRNQPADRAGAHRSPRPREGQHAQPDRGQRRRGVA